MKNFRELFLIAMLITCFVAPAQVTKMDFSGNAYATISIKGKVKIENGDLYVVHPSGVYCAEINENGDLMSSSLRKSELFDALEDVVIKDFVLNGESIYVVTYNTLGDGKALLRSVDNGKTWEDMVDWPFGLPQINKYITPKLRKGVHDNPNEFYVIIDGIFHTSDFGKTFNQTGTYKIWKCNPYDSKILFDSCEIMVDCIDNIDCKISYDRGATFKYISSFYALNDIAFHCTNPNIMVILGSRILVTKDCGESWEEIVYWGDDHEKIILSGEFDSRGSDRLYATRANELLYSDDFGITWNELCKIELEEGDELADFIQYNKHIYTYSKKYSVHQIDLELLESSIEEVSCDGLEVSVSVSGDYFRINAQALVSEVKIYNVGGIEVYSQNGIDDINLADFTKGTYIARISTSDGKIATCKFNK